MATVMLDAGHGGYDNGASFEGRKEKDDNLNLVLAIGNILENNGVDVLYTRTTDIYQSPNEKANIANRSDASYFVSIHRNSSPQPNTYSGVQTLVYADAGIPALFAQNINRELEKVGYANLGTSVRPNLAVLRGTNMPAALVEVGFINTEQDNRLLDLKFPEIADNDPARTLIIIQVRAIAPSLLIRCQQRIIRLLFTLAQVNVDALLLNDDSCFRNISINKLRRLFAVLHIIHQNRLFKLDSVFRCFHSINTL